MAWVIYDSLTDDQRFDLHLKAAEDRDRALAREERTHSDFCLAMAPERLRALIDDEISLMRPLADTNEKSIRETTRIRHIYKKIYRKYHKES